jgi:cytochrome c peroxidase
MLSSHPGLWLPGLLSLLLGGCARGPAADSGTPDAAPATVTTAEVSSEINPRLLRRFQPISPVFESARTPLTPERIALGRRLFHEPRLSRTKTLSCNGCHDLDRFGVDEQPTSLGIDGQRGTRNAPSVYNAAGAFTQFWDGRAASIEDQAKAPILNPLEMGMATPEAVVARLKAIPDYEAPFRAAFPDEADPIRYRNVGVAIGAFERGLMTPGRWDRFLDGDTGALTRPEKDGLKVFLNAGCMVCHTGPLVGGSMFQRIGIMEPWPNQRDTGRMMVTHAEQDRMMFKVPSLRNVEKTGPYFHDGSVARLEDAVHEMGTHQLGLDLTSAEVASIVTWLRALTGDVPLEYTRPGAAFPTAANGQ